MCRFYWEYCNDITTIWQRTVRYEVHICTLISIPCNLHAFACLEHWNYLFVTIYLFTFELLVCIFCWFLSLSLSLSLCFLSVIFLDHFAKKKTHQVKERTNRYALHFVQIVVVFSYSWACTCTSFGILFSAFSHWHFSEKQTESLRNDILCVVQKMKRKPHTFHRSAISHWIVFVHWYKRIFLFAHK